jgi:hypothetical protein
MSPNGELGRIVGVQAQDPLPPKWENGEDCVRHLTGCLERLQRSRDDVELVLHRRGEKGTAELQRRAYDRYLTNLGSTLASVATAYQASYISADQFHALRNDAIKTAVQSVVGGIVL